MVARITEAGAPGEEICEFGDEGDPQESEFEQTYNKHRTAWQAFVSKSEWKDVPKLQEYTQAKNNRLQRKQKFEQSLEIYICALRDSSKQLLLETSRKYCNSREVKLKAMQKEIEEVLISNHSRRNTSLQRMGEADREWKKRFSEVTESVLSGVSPKYEEIE